MTEEQIARNLDSRLAAIEANHLKQQKEVSALAKDIGALTQAEQGVSAAVSRIAENQTASMRTNWSVIFGGLGVAVLVAGLVIYEPLNRLTGYHRNHIQDGHPKSVLDKILADERRLESRLDRKQLQLFGIEERLDALVSHQESVQERLLGIEREIYSGASYRSGRPVRPAEGD